MQPAQGRKAHPALSTVTRNIDRLEITVRNGNIRTSHTSILARSGETDHPIGQIREKWPDRLEPDNGRIKGRESLAGSRQQLYQVLRLPRPRSATSKSGAGCCDPRACGAAY